MGCKQPDSVVSVLGPPLVVSFKIINALKSVKNGKPFDGSGITAEILKDSNDIEIIMLTDLINTNIKEGIRNSFRWPWKRKGDALECGNYRGRKLFDEVIKVGEYD